MATPKSKAVSNRAPRLDIFDQIRAVQQRDYTWLDSQPDQLKKTFVPFILNRWLSGSSDPSDVLAADIANKYMWSLHDHPTLLWRLMCATGSSRSRRSWIKAAGKTNTGNDLRVSIIADHHQVSYREAKIILDTGLITVDYIIQMAEELGMQSDVTDKLKKFKQDD